MTPMVDVVMVILVFFMASAVFLGPEWFLRTAIPQIKPVAAAVANPEKKTLRVRLTNVGGEERASIDGGEPITLKELEAALKAAAGSHSAANLTIVVVPAPEALYESVVAVHELCQRLGIARIGIVEEEQPQ
jgi:biopolymer transport protein ExbD